jgi:hypothetical protein
MAAACTRMRHAKEKHLWYFGVGVRTVGVFGARAGDMHRPCRRRSRKLPQRGMADWSGLEFCRIVRLTLTGLTSMLGPSEVSLDVAIASPAKCALQPKARIYDKL